MARHPTSPSPPTFRVFRPRLSPWECGINENTNGLIREYLPKGTKIPGDIDYMWAVADSLNDRAPDIFVFRKLSEVFTELMLQEAEISPA